jgi:hypothetical protein
MELIEYDQQEYQHDPIRFEPLPDHIELILRYIALSSIIALVAFSIVILTYTTFRKI